MFGVNVFGAPLFGQGYGILEEESAPESPREFFVVEAQDRFFLVPAIAQERFCVVEPEEVLT